MITVVVDNTVLSNFAHTLQPGLVSAAFEQPVTVPAVVEELSIGVSLGRIPVVDWHWLPVVELTTKEQEDAERLQETLGRGEAQCIALATSRTWMVLTDDRDARRVAQALGVRISGTLGALMNLVRHHVLSLAEADENLRLMKKHGYYAPVDSLAELMGR